MGWVCVIQNINTDSCNKHPEDERFCGEVKVGDVLLPLQWSFGFVGQSYPKC